MDFLIYPIKLFSELWDLHFFHMGFLPNSVGVSIFNIIYTIWSVNFSLYITNTCIYFFSGSPYFHVKCEDSNLILICLLKPILG